LKDLTNLRVIPEKLICLLQEYCAAQVEQSKLCCCYPQKKSDHEMNVSLAVQDLAIVYAVERQDPTLLSPDFLRYSGIVPTDWEVAQQPVRTQQAAQVRFENGVTIVAYPNQVVFAQSLATTQESVEIPAVAQRFSEVLRNMVYQGVGINLRGYVPFAGEGTGTARQFMFDSLLAPGDWQNFGEAPVQASLNLNYQLERCQLGLSINEAVIQLPEQQSFPVLLFAGNFNYLLPRESEAERLQSVSVAVSHWQEDIETFKKLVSEKFLSAAEPEILPTLFATAQ
jgi:hypothetical protein